MRKLIVAGGCFWGVQEYLKRVKGISKTRAGYIDGKKASPTYKEVCDSSGHAEAVYFEYDENQISLEKILEHYFNIVDPTLVNRQGNDIGVQYRSAIYYFIPSDAVTIKKYIEDVQKNYDKPIQTVVKPAGKFWIAEEYHQNYLEKNPSGYCHIDLTKINNISED